MQRSRDPRRGVPLSVPIKIPYRDPEGPEGPTPCHLSDGWAHPLLVSIFATRLERYAFRVNSGAIFIVSSRFLSSQTTPLECVHVMHLRFCDTSKEIATYCSAGLELCSAGLFWCYIHPRGNMLHLQRSVSGSEYCDNYGT